MHKGDMNGALTDFNHAISLGGKADNAYYGRALVEQAQGALDAAIADYHQTLASAPPGGDNPHFYLWLARVQQNQKADADKELSDYIAKRPTTRKQDWQSKIGGFLLGQVTEANLATYALSFPNPADQSRAQCESWYFIGMKRQIAGEKDAAADDFRKCLGTNQTVLTQYVLAKAAAEALDLNPGQ
jgi:lipoprotein NlpI